MKVRIDNTWEEHEVSTEGMRPNEPYIAKGGDESIVWFRAGSTLLSIRNGDRAIYASSILGYRDKRFILLSDMEIEIIVKKRS